MARPSLQVPLELVAAFQQLKDKSPQQTVVTTQHSSNSAQVQMCRPFPVSLPACQVLSTSFGHRYGLNTVQTLADHSLSSPATRSASQLLHHPYQAQQARALLQAQNMAQHLLTVCTVSGLLLDIPNQKAQPNLDSFLDPSLIIHFVSYHVAAQHTPSTIHGFLFAAKKVIQW